MNQESIMEKGTIVVPTGQLYRSTDTNETHIPISRQRDATSDVNWAKRVVENRKQLGPVHPATLLSMFEIGKALHGDGLVEKALGVFQELLPLNEQVYGRNDAATIAVLDAVCEELCNMGKYEQCLVHLTDERIRCEQALGLDHERTIRVLVHIAHVGKLLDKTGYAAYALYLALDRARRRLGDRHYVTLGVRNSIRELKEQPSQPSLDEMKAILRKNNLPVPAKPFPIGLSATWRDVAAGKRIEVITTVSYEASNAMSLRMGPINGNEKALSPIHTPPHVANPNKIELSRVLPDKSPNHSFQALVDRSIQVLPRGGTPATRQAVEKHTLFLKGFSCLEDLLAAKETPFWFFQRRESFIQQTRFQKWDPKALGCYVLLPTGGEFANSEDCVFVSHYWRTQEHPDPDGEDLRQLQGLLNEGFWSKSALFWVDWTCLPQKKRTGPEDEYFRRVLASIPRLVRDCSFVAQFAEYQARLWVLFEVAAFTFNRAEPVGLPCTDMFERHLSQMRGEGVREVLNRYGYQCTNQGDREWVVTSLEVLLALRKTVPSIHTRRQILDAIDNAVVRSCVHQEAGVKVDKERGLLKGPGGDTFQFNPLPVQNGIDVHIYGDYEARLGRGMQRAIQSVDDAGVGEMAREYERAGEYQIAEALHRLALDRNKDDVVASYDLIANFESQEKYEAAAAQCRQFMARHGARDDVTQKLAAMEQKVKQMRSYRTWVSQPLEETLHIAGWPATTVHQPVLRNGLKRSWLQRLDQRVWQIEDPLILKSMEELALQENRPSGPCHADTRRSLCAFGRTCLAVGDTEVAHVAYWVALAVYDVTLGARHPESRAVLADLAGAVLARGRPGLARGYYRQHLERTLAVAEWGNDEALVSKFFLHALTGDVQLVIVQGKDDATVLIMGRAPGTDAEEGHNPALDLAASKEGISNPGSLEKRNVNPDSPQQVLLLDMENTDFIFKRHTIARK
ncbi:uncharacterized protein PG998_012833 [Apiospora kogelbergensis]|uniref:uncharacterized protein n=1 Tax=Apiospora kogelbergensis TaxID=1337665 RepID=UPI003131EA07